MSRVFVDFERCKSEISLPDVLAVFGIADQFQQRNGIWRGSCPFPAHLHNPVRPNPNGFTFGVHEGVWKWHCWGDCKAVGSIITFVERYLQIEPAHVRLWFHEHFPNSIDSRRRETVTEGERVSRNATQSSEEPSINTQAPECSKNHVVEAIQPFGKYKPIRFLLNLEPDTPYLRQRGIAKETTERYGIGLCGRGMLKGFIAIPVWEHPRGTFPLGYIGRWAGEDHDEGADRPRYKCPPGFPMSTLVYGLSEALETPAEKPLIVVEGCFKVFHLFQNGFPNTVSSLTSSISDVQAVLLADTGRPIVLMFDGDEAGRTGTLAAMPKLAGRCFVRTVCLDDGVEPDDLTAEQLQKLLSGSQFASA